MLKTWLTAVFTATGYAASNSFLPSGLTAEDISKRSYSPDFGALEDFLVALGVMQDEYFQPWIGEWPSAIDWTAAVMGSHVSGALSTLSTSLGLYQLEGDDGYKLKENIIDLYFSQVVGSYYGQNALSIRHQAFDDMLWVVLGWLDTTQFINLHTASYHQGGSQSAGMGEGIPDILRNQTWHGNTWVPAFAHRARVFWEIASKGWDWVLCGGGMTWNPRLEPYKNAITNELYIAASISMYLYFPGDTNAHPYASKSDSDNHDSDPSETAEWGPHDEKYLFAAMNGYIWLMDSGMMNSKGLFIDGFHISGYRNKSNPNTKCDVRNEMVYTYNQGVVLSGQIGLFRSLGDMQYLADGHALIRSVIAATGYGLTIGRPIDDISKLPPGQLPPWHGLGRAGVLEDLCDPRGDCSQNGHTFKGIFFHHLTTFCASLDPATGLSRFSMSEEQFAEIKGPHGTACAAYRGWVQHNAKAALLTRDSKGRFGTWWTAGLLNLTSANSIIDDDGGLQRDDAVDYRNHGVPDDPLWVSEGDPGLSSPVVSGPPLADSESDQRPLGGSMKRSHLGGDPNDRGRGRTVETQGGGVALLRALWEISRLSPDS